MTLKRSLLLALLLVHLMFAKTALSQSTAPTARTPGAPNGSYSFSDFESVNLFSGNLNVNLPLLSINGRGSAWQMLTLTIETQWNVDRFETGIPDNWGHNITPRSPWPVGFIGELTSETVVDQTGEDTCGGGNWVNHRFNFTFVDTDGTEHILVDPVYHGRPYKTCATISTNYGRVFDSTNGEFMTFVSDADVWSFGTATGYLHYKDGRKSRIVNTRIMWTQDRNGNKTVYEYEANDPLFYPPLAKKITDSIGRQIIIAYDVNEGSPYGICDKITYKGYQGADRIIRVSKGGLQNFLRTTQIYDSSTIKTKVELFPDNPSDSVYIANPNDPQNPVVVGAVWLPDGRSYQFKYNVYGRLARVVLPTGGAIEYDYEPSLLNGPGAADAFIVNRVNEKRVYKDGTTLESKTTFTGTQTSQGFPTGSSGWVMDVDQFDHLGNRLTKVKHFFNGFANGTWGYVVPWWNGREVKTEFFAANGTTVLRRVENDWRQRIPSWCFTSQPVASPCGPNPSQTAPTINPFIVETKTTLVDANLVSKTSALKPDGSFGFDNYNNQTDLYEYDFGSGVVGPLKRHTQWVYLSTSAYTNNDVHLLNLTTRASVYDGAEVERVRTTYEYDVYSGTNHAALKDWSSVTGVGMFGHDSAFNGSNLIRGNVTATTQHLLTNGVVTGSVTNFTQYDLAGNPVKAIDANGNVTTLEYLDSFGGPNGEARTNGPSGLTGTGLNSYAFATVVTNSLNHKTYSQFDYYLGQPVDVEDTNSILSSFVFNDFLDRPTQIKRAVGMGKENQTTYNYDDTNRIITTSTDRDSNNDNVLVSKTIYDQLGRVTEARRYEGGSNYIATQAQYDDAGRAFKISNPFRPWQSESAIWITQAFDALGRITSVTTPDNALITTTYSGNAVTVTDQAGKGRKSVTDALGRLIEVFEDPAGLNYQTSYTYDVRDSLVKVVQGTQQRYFMYDSLKRLIRSRNPEQGTLASLNLSDSISGNSAWSLGYQYDSVGNLTQHTDARGIVSTYTYDALNRPTTIDYSDTASVNPDVSRFYDGATNGKGQLWYSYAGGSETAGSTVEKTLIESYDVLGQPLVLKQLFKANGVWSTPYQITRSYNVSGGVTSQTYPSTHAVTYNYDAAGRLADKDASNLAFTGNLGDGVQRTYARGVTYASGGLLKQEQFGTTTAVYNKRFYNSRQQLAEILASTTGNDNSWNRGKIINGFSLQCSGASCNATDNNGNPRKQEIFIPANDQVSSYTSWYQQFDYDSLNRLLRVHEYTGNVSLDWQQEYVYDRWGNRTLHQTNTFGLGINKKNFTVDTATNRLGVPGGQSGTLTYDAAGNLTTDTYTGAGNRTYDADNKMTSAQDNSGGWSYYTYNADGQRTRRKTGIQEIWQVYGFDGELLAEYVANSGSANPQKEYGYRNGQLLITADGRTNVALAANGGVASASSYHTCCGFSLGGAINGNIRGPWGNGEGWNDATENVLPDWYQVDFAGSKTIDQIDVFSLHDNYTEQNIPTETQTFSLYGLVNFQMQYWNGSAWTTIPGGNVTGNNKVWRKFAFSPITTSKIRLWITSVPDSWSRLVELQAWQANTGTTNLAVNKPATQSSTDWGAPAQRGVDGNTDGVFGNGSVTHTATQSQPWWQVDLQSVSSIQNINVWNRTDCCGEALSNFYVFVSDNPFTANDVASTQGQAGVSTYFVTGQAGAPSTVTVNRTGRYVRVQLGITERLSVAEVQVLGGGSGPQVRWLLTDQLGTPRMVFDQSGSLANVKRHDYLPFGEELIATQGLRTVTIGYGGDGVRQQFSRQERDSETGLDYFNARYYLSTQGRFTSVDPDNYQARLIPTDPQSWNGYSYVNNNPLLRIDPSGKGDLWEKIKNALMGRCICTNAEFEQRQKEEEERRRKDEEIRRQELREYSQRRQLNGYLIVQGEDGKPKAVTVESLNRDQVMQISQTLRYLEYGIPVEGVGEISGQDAANLISLAAGLPIYRGGANLNVRDADIRIDKATGLVKPGRGVSVQSVTEGLEKYGGAYKIDSVPPELEVVQIGKNPNHFEIAPRAPMERVVYEKLLQQIKLSPVTPP